MNFRHHHNSYQYCYQLNLPESTILTRDISNQAYQKEDPNTRKRRILVLDASNIDSFCYWLVGDYTYLVKWNALWNWGFDKV